MKGQIVFDLQDSELIVHELTRQGSAFRISDTQRSAINEGAVVLDKRLSGVRDAYLSLPLSLINFRIIELPFCDTKKIHEVLPLELATLILQNPEDIILDFHILNSSPERSKVLAVYIEKSALKKILEMLKAIGADPKYISSLSLAAILGSYTSGAELADMLLVGKVLSEREYDEVVIKEFLNPVINFRSGEFAYTRDRERAKRSLKLASILLLLLCGIFLANAAITIGFAKRESSHIKAEMRRDYTALFPNEKKIASELYQLKAHMKEMKNKDELFRGADPLSVLTKLSAVERSGASFNEITIDRDYVVLKGEAPSLSSMQQIRDALTKHFAEVRVSDSKTGAQSRVLFTITVGESKS